MQCPQDGLSVQLATSGIMLDRVCKLQKYIIYHTEHAMAQFQLFITLVTLLLQLLTGTIFSDLSSTFIFRVLNLAILNSTEQ